MKRSPLRRMSTKKCAALKGQRVTSTLKAKGGDRFKGLRLDAYRDWVRAQGCIIASGCRGRVEAAHVKSRGAGGRDAANLYPACTRHHTEQHTSGIVTFQQKYSTDLEVLAQAYWHQYERDVLRVAL